MSSYGLINSDDNARVPLHSIKVKASVQGFIANVETELLYENQDDNPIEASFVFPIDDNSAVYKFEAVIEGRLIVGECQGKEEARQTYQDAIEAGETAFLMEEDDTTGDIFECKVGNLPPKTSAKVTFTYVTRCEVQGKDKDGKDVTTFTYPCVLGPRYAVSTVTDTSDASQPGQPGPSSGGTSSSKGKSKRQKIPTYTKATDISYTFSAEVTYHSSSSNQVRFAHVNTDNKKNESSSTWVHKQEFAKVQVREFVLDRDLIVEFYCTNQYEPMLYLEKGDPSKSGMLKHDLAVLQFHPDIQDYVKKPSTKGEYLFIIDRSGSMYGERIANAKKALSYCLDQLPEDCYFNIISFGSTHSAHFKVEKNSQGCGVKNSKSNLDSAKKHVTTMDSNMGGTEMVKPFEWIYKKPTISGYPRQIVLLTDGAIWQTSEDSFFNLVKRNNKYARVFTFGIGFGASTTLVRGLARAGKGKCDFIKEDMHKMKKQVANLLKCATSPAVDDIKLEIQTPPGIGHTLIPTELPPVFLGEHFVTYAMLSGSLKGKEGTLIATLTGTSEKKIKITYSVEADLKHIATKTFEAEHMPLHRVAAKAQIKELQDGETYDGECKDKIKLVSTASNIMSRYTSFVGVDKGRVEKVQGKQKHVDIPIAKLSEGKGKKKAKSQASGAPSFAAAAFRGPRLVGGGAAPAAAPRLYGGAGPDAPEAEKYIGGKVPDIPGIESSVKKSGMALLLEKKAVESPSQPSDTSALNGSQESSIIHKFTTNEGEVSVKPSNKTKQRKRHIGESRKLTIKKRRIAVKVTEAKFAKWEDGYYYFATALQNGRCKPERAHIQMKFKGGAVRYIHKKDILMAKLLSPGDEISVHCKKETYCWAMVLEYTADTDQFVVTYGDGTIFKCKTQDIVIPVETAQIIMDRREYDAQPKVLAQFQGTDGQLRQLSTSDLAELSAHGWVNEPVVTFWLSHILPTKAKPDLLQKSHVLSPRFFLTLTDSLQMSEDFLTFPGELQTIIIERRWRNYILRDDKWRGSKVEEADILMNGIDITEKETLIVPMFDETHWYVILIQIKQEQSDSKAYRATFFTMDSYFKTAREYETAVIKRYVTDAFQKKGKQVKFEPGAYQYHVPIQGNNWDCGLCMLQCIENTFQEGLKPEPHLFWFYQEDLQDKRRETARMILDVWERTKCNKQM